MSYLPERSPDARIRVPLDLHREAISTKLVRSENPDASIRATSWWRCVMAGVTGLFLVITNAQVQSPSAPSTDPALEARVKALSAELRCLVCQNQTIADSDAPVARDLREQVRTQLAAGRSESEVKQYMTDRFGDFVLYKPPLKASTIALWAGPFVAMLLAAVLLVRRVRNTSSRPHITPVTDADRERARALLNDPNPTRDPPVA
jgi:cytochrome c-type biogenesis protein CcmH